MKSHRHTLRLVRDLSYWQAGVSLIELMISLVIGMLVILAAVQLFSANKSGSIALDDSARIQENARAALDVMARHIRMAGYHPLESAANFPNTSGVCVNSVQQAICGRNPDDGTFPNKSDEIRVRFWGTSVPVGGAADGETRDCAGNALSATDIVEERFRVQNVNRNPGDATTATPTIVCAILNGAAAITAGSPETVVPLVFGVDTMQVLYAEDTDSDRVANRWRSADLVTNFANVYALQIGLVLRGEGRANAAAARTYKPFGEQYAAPGSDSGASFDDPLDRRQRRTAVFSVEFRNRSQ
ncbi:PilW family protein [Niveibacterium sp.]|uniref:PilW family protein n=1 Tax=Niveibacterium sp. TaxID=2017444 RepID=UPI0035B49871